MSRSDTTESPTSEFNRTVPDIDIGCTSCENYIVYLNVNNMNIVRNRSLLITTNTSASIRRPIVSYQSQFSKKNIFMSKRLLSKNCRLFQEKKSTLKPDMEHKSDLQNTRNKVDVANATSHSHSHQMEHDHGHSHQLESNHEHHHDDEHGHGILGHSHSHHQPNELLSSSLSNPAVRVTWIGLIVNIGLAISKAVGGVYFHSQSLVADAIHSVSDMVADFLTLATVNVASKIGTPDKFPLGYGKIESVGSFLVSGVLLFAGISVGWSSLLQVFEFTMPSYMYDYVSKIQVGHSHSHSNLVDTSVSQSHDHSHSDSANQAVNTSQKVPDINAAWLAAGSIVVKELLFQKTMKVANETNSKVLVANAWHHRVDSLTALVAVVTVTGGVMFNVAWLDSIGGLLVSVLIIRAGWGSFKNSIYELIDRGETKNGEISLKCKSIINESLNQQPFKISKLSVLASGANSNIFITVVTPTNYRMNELNDLESNIITSIKDLDKFIRNVFVQFKQVDNDVYEKLNDESINNSH